MSLELRLSVTQDREIVREKSGAIILLVDYTSQMAISFMNFYGTTTLNDILKSTCTLQRN